MRLKFEQVSRHGSPRYLPPPTRRRLIGESCPGGPTLPSELGTVPRMAPRLARPAPTTTVFSSGMAAAKVEGGLSTFTAWHQLCAHRAAEGRGMDGEGICGGNILFYSIAGPMPVSLPIPGNLLNSVCRLVCMLSPVVSSSDCKLAQ